MPNKFFYSAKDIVDNFLHLLQDRKHHEGITCKIITSASKSIPNPCVVISVFQLLFSYYLVTLTHQTRQRYMR